MTVEIKKDMVGSILDIGGGGECVIGQIYGNRVTAIDNMQEELDEAPDCCEKVLMDATSLTFLDASFDNVTFFYSLMYMSRKTQMKAIDEAFRVLKPGGSMFIWDTDIRSAYPEPFEIELDIVSNGTSIHTTYGILKNETQSLKVLLPHIQTLEIMDLNVVKNSDQFEISLRKGALTERKNQSMKIIKYEESYRDDMIYMVLQAKDALGRIPTINNDLLDIQSNYFEHNDMFWLAIDADNRVIGCVGCSRISNTNEAFLHRLFIKPSLKRKGIGSSLLDTAESWMRENGIAISKVHLGSPKEQWFESYAFYPKHGYTEYEPRYMKKVL